MIKGKSKGAGFNSSSQADSQDFKRLPRSSLELGFEPVIAYQGQGNDALLHRVVVMLVIGHLFLN